MEGGRNLFGGAAACGWGGNQGKIVIGAGMFGDAGGSSAAPEVTIGTGGQPAEPIKALWSSCGSLIDVVG